MTAGVAQADPRISSSQECVTYVIVHVTKFVYNDNKSHQCAFKHSCLCDFNPKPMPTQLTTQQILGLAPDASSAKSARSLASPRSWHNLGASQRAIWGECQGSGAKPYQSQVDLSGPAFRCSCPSRKFPCKHGLALLLLYAERAETFESHEPPAWVTEWLSKREASAEKTRASTAEAQAADPATEKRRARARASTAAARESKVEAGVRDLELWLADLVRQGLSEAQQRSTSSWSHMAARMTDAQAPGLGRLVRQIGSSLSSGEGWQARTLDLIGRLHLLLSAYKKFEQLPEASQADVRSTIGWTIPKELLQEQALLQDSWLVLGQRQTEEDGLRSQHTWLWGEQNQRWALILAFATAGQAFESNFIVGTRLQAGLRYYPGAFPMRASIAESQSLEASVRSMPGHEQLEQALMSYATALAANPWLERVPFALRAVVPYYQAAQWWIADSRGQSLPLARYWQGGWQLLALSGGRPIDVLAEWNGSDLFPLSAIVDGMLYELR